MASFKTLTELAKEWGALSWAWGKQTSMRLPARLVQAAIQESALVLASDHRRFLQVVGDSFVDMFDDLGPLYGKVAQITLSRLTPEWQARAAVLRLDRLYGRWPALPWQKIELILDEEIPAWRDELEVEPVPLGVASIAQVHAARDRDGRQWVIKLVKPQARDRLTTSLNALRGIIATIKPLALTRFARRFVADLESLAEASQLELSMGQERNTLVELARLGDMGKVLRIPAVHEKLHSDSVLVMERFRGISLADIVSGKVPLSDKARATLAKTVLRDLLLQVFELGVFHGDPHAGNLILLEDGSVGLFDWGLTGQLSERDRHHIAMILRATMTLDLDRLADALISMVAEEGGEPPAKEDVLKELRSLSQRVNKTKKRKAKKGEEEEPEEEAPMGVRQLLQNGLQAAEKLGLEMPTGLLMMARTLVTIEGLAKGLDADISFVRVASPLLWRTARPGAKDIFIMAKKLPSLLRHLVGIFLLGCLFLPAASLKAAPAMDQETWGILGDSISTGGGALPGLTFGHQKMWDLLQGKTPVSPAENKTPPRRLPPVLTTYYGAPFWFWQLAFHGLGRVYLDTEESSWSYFLAEHAHLPPRNLLIAAQDGARAQDFTEQVDRILAATGGLLPRRLFLFPAGNDVCAANVGKMTLPEDFAGHLKETIAYLRQRGKPPAEGTQIYMMGMLPVTTLVLSEAIQNKSIDINGEAKTCKDLYGGAGINTRMTEAPQGDTSLMKALVTHFLPPHPLLLCGSLFMRDQAGTYPGLPTVANRLRSLRQEAQEIARAESTTTSPVKVSFVGATGEVHFVPEDIAADCFHLSAAGQAKIAAIMAENL